jgi:hypothetical protein
MKKEIRLTEDALKYKNEWVAFSADYQRVVGHGVTGREAAQQAKNAGEKHAILLFIPEEMPDLIVL